ncbi:hypothetical protein QQ045_019801 [Rhodiola kirilowii]
MSGLFHLLPLIIVAALFVNIDKNGGIIAGKVCNLYRGRWVYNESYPLYNVSACPFVLSQFKCVANGRPDQLYLKFEWMPKSCSLPRFDASRFLNEFKGKKIMFVGDSLSLNQWESLNCMLHSALPHTPYTLVRYDTLSTFTFLEYNVSISFSRNAYLVDLTKYNSIRVLKLDSVGSGRLWETSDVLIFNTWHWWLHSGNKQVWDFVTDGEKVTKDMNRLAAYEIALNTWAKWVEANINTNKTKLFFQGVSPDHINASEWLQPGLDRCVGQVKPLRGSRYPGGHHPAQVVLKKVLYKMRNKVHLLDITTLSQLRVDGHPSLYVNTAHKYADCAHWCLGGVPDTWNELLYASLFPE